MTSTPETQPMTPEYFATLLQLGGPGIFDGALCRALRLALKGYRVFPLKPKEKVPAIEAWPQLASSDPFKVYELFADRLDCGIGIACGDLVALDADGAEGLESMRRFKFPANTPTITTPTLGEHYLFRPKPGKSYGNRAKVLPGFDVRGVGGYIVAIGEEAWSRKPGKAAVFGQYRGKGIDELPALSDLPILPDEVDELLSMTFVEPTPDKWIGGTCEGWQAKITDKLRERMQAVSADGDRSEDSYAVMCSLFEMGCTDEDVLDAAEDPDNHFATKFVDRGDIRREIVRARGRWNRNKTKGFEAQPGSSEAPKADQAKPAISWRDKIISAADLEHEPTVPIKWCLPGFVPEGMSLLVARPKFGKSWLTLDLAIAIATGGTCLGVQVEQGDVLVLAFEDNKRRMKQRMGKLCPKGWPKRMTISNNWSRAHEGGLDDIEQWAKSVPNPRLVIIDTWQRFRAPQKTKGYSEDYDDGALIQKLAIRLGLPILVVHHDRKQSADDVYDTISGTLGIAAALDTQIMMKRTSKGATLHVRGRDIEERELAIEFTKDTCRWRLLGEAAEVQRSDERKTVHEAFRIKSTWGVSELAEHTEMKSVNLRKLLGSMVKDGELTKLSRNVYSVLNGFTTIN